MVIMVWWVRELSSLGKLRPCYIKKIGWLASWTFRDIQGPGSVFFILLNLSSIRFWREFNTFCQTEAFFVCGKIFFLYGIRLKMFFGLTGMPTNWLFSETP